MKFNSQHSNPLPITRILKEPYDLVYVNLAGPFLLQSLSVSYYTMPILDDCTQYSKIVFLKERSKASKFLIAFYKRIHTKTGRYSKAIHTDNGGEFKNSVWTAYCESKGIIH